MAPRRAAFTLLEICLTLCIGMVLILLAVPSVVGVLAERRLHESVDRFEELAYKARSRSVQEQRPYRLVWDKKGIILEKVAQTKAEKEEPEMLTPAEGEVYEMTRTAALAENAPAIWTFWPDGTCEPVIVSSHGPAGRWRVRFDAFTSHGILLESGTS